VKSTTPVIRLRQRPCRCPLFPSTYFAQVLLFPFLFATLVPWHTLELLSDLPMPCFSILILFIDPLNCILFCLFSVSVQFFQPAANMQVRSLFREDLSIRRRFPDLEMSHRYRLPAKSQAPRQHLLSAQSEPWTVTFGGCTFSGGAPLVRTGSCPTQAGTLDLSSKGITSVQPDAFQDMPQMQ
jgi:hypothetical protein